MAHRLQLAAEKAAHEVPYLVKYIGIVNQLAKTMKFSPKFLRMLETAKDLNEEKSNKVKQIFFTRWLSFQDTVQSLSGCLPSVISTLYAAAQERGMEGRAMLQGVAKQMATYKFVASTYFLADAIGLLGILSKSLQVEGVSYSESKDMIEGTMTSLNALKETKGPHMEQLEISKEPDSSGFSAFKGHEIKDSEKERDTVQGMMLDFIDAVCGRLQIAFPDADAMEDFNLFNPRSGLVNDKAQASASLKRLTERYSSIITSEEDTVLEYAMLTPLLHKYKEESQREFFKKNLHPRREAMPNLAKIAAIALMIPVASVECERGISRLNYIKNDQRSSLSSANVNVLMKLALEAKPLRLFDFENAFQHWVTKKDRVAYIQMLKSCK